MSGRPWRIFSTCVAPVAVVLTIAAKSMGEPVRPEDLWWHLAMGRTIVASGAVPRVDAFTFTRAGEPFFDQAWLAQVLLYEAQRPLGLAGLLAIDFAIMLGAAWLVITAARARGAKASVAAVVLALLGPVALRGYAIRPQALVVPLFALVLLLLARSKRGAPRWELAFVPLVVMAWANLHGSFPLAIGLVVLSALGAMIARENKRAGDLALASLGALLATLANPRGAAIWTYVKAIATNPSVHYAREWQPLHPTDFEGLYVMIVLALTAYVAWKKRAPLAELVVVTPFAVLAIVAVRNGIWLALVLTAFVPAWLSRANEEEGSAFARGARIAAAVALVALAIPWVKPRVLGKPLGPLAWERRTPISATAFLVSDPDPPDHVFARAAFGNYLAWARPDHPVFMDSRLELYPKELWDEAFAIEAGDLSAARLGAHRIDAFLVDRHEERALEDALSRSSAFERRYVDDDVAYFASKKR